MFQETLQAATPSILPGNAQRIIIRSGSSADSAIAKELDRMLSIDRERQIKTQAPVIQLVIILSTIDRSLAAGVIDRTP